MPRAPTRIPSDTYTIWPVNLDLGPVRLKYATAQLLCRLDNPRTYVFFSWPGIAPEFAFEDKPGTSIESFARTLSHEQGITYVEGLTSGTQFSIRVTTRLGAITNIVVLSREQALNLWKTKLNSKEHLILSSAGLYFANDLMDLTSFDPSALNAGFFPGPEHPPANLNPEGEDGIFQTYATHVEKLAVAMDYSKTTEAGARPALTMKNEVAVVPDDAAFSEAARWTINVHPPDADLLRNVFLKLHYEGDIARLYVDGKLVTDNFYNGATWWIGMDRIPAKEWNHLQLKILPLQARAPLYLPKEAWPTIPPHSAVATLKSIETAFEHDVVLEFRH